jgi:serine/threonine protein kinase, bacterial
MLTSTIVPKLPIHPQFAVVNVVRAADFGWEYLVKDCQAPGRLWLLEEFLPSAATPADLGEVRAALQAVIEPLRSLDHPQLAISREIVSIDNRLFWLREYIAGHSCRTLLDDRLDQGAVFSVAEVYQVLMRVLPLLSHLHDREIFHGALDLDAIIWRDAVASTGEMTRAGETTHTSEIVLTRFGRMREMGLAYGFYLLTPLAHQNWPADQRGIDRDLFDLACVALSLLTGEASPCPMTTLDQIAQAQPDVSDDFLAILQQMLQPKLWQRFKSAAAVTEALELLEPLEPLESLEPLMAAPTAAAPNRSVDRLIANAFTVPIEPPVGSIVQPFRPPSAPAPSARSRQTPVVAVDPILIALSVVLMGLLTFLGWRLTRLAVKSPNLSPNPATGQLRPIVIKPSSSPLTSAPTPATDGSERLGVDADLINQLTLESGQPAAIKSVLNALSEEARRELGSYYRRNYDRWYAALAARKISQPTIDVLADTSLHLYLPQLTDKTLNPRSFGQLWYALARDHITDLSQGQNLETLKAGTFNQSGQLTQGQGRVFQVQVPPGKTLQVKLNEPTVKPQSAALKPVAVKISIVANEIVLIRQSTQTQWQAPQSGRATTYEIILTPTQLTPSKYRLSLTCP